VAAWWSVGVVVDRARQVVALAVEVFRLLADVTRVQLLRALAAGGLPADGCRG
jgi:hypothetical protein